MVFFPVAVAIAAFSAWVVVSPWSDEPLDQLGITVLMSLPFLGLCFITLYFALVALLNTATIDISRGRLMVEQGPIPSARRRDIDSTTVQQGCVIRRESRHTFSYKLYALTRGGPHKHLVTVDDGQLALYLEQEIERSLGMEDQVVRGGWRPEPYLWTA
jgi:hypothetical protein